MTTATARPHQRARIAFRAVQNHVSRQELMQPTECGYTKSDTPISDPLRQNTNQAVDCIGGERGTRTLDLGIMSATL